MVGAAVTALAGLLAMPARIARATDAAAAPALPTLAADRAAEAMAAGEITLIDIRTPEEWRQSGVAQGARMLAMQDPEFWPKFQAIRAEAPERPVALICATGGRSAHVGQALARHGVTGLYHVSEGMMGSPAGPGWLRRGLPVEKP
jgi:rhodanese-related sulfurtransferase